MVRKSKLPRIRPRFAFPIKRSKEKALEIMSNALDNTDKRIEGVIIGNHVMLDVIKEDRHFWSPQMNFRFTIDEEEPKITKVKGIIGPRPATWTLFMFFYFLIGTIGFLLSSYGLSKWSLDEYSVTIWAFPISLVIMATAFITGKIGEKLGKTQTTLLSNFLYEAITK